MARSSQDNARLVQLPQLNLEFMVESSSARELSLLSFLLEKEVPLSHSCAGQAVCGTCAVFLEGDKIPTPTPSELKLIQKQGKDGHCRFACQIFFPHEAFVWIVKTPYW